MMFATSKYFIQLKNVVKFLKKTLNTVYIFIYCSNFNIFRCVKLFLNTVLSHEKKKITADLTTRNTLPMVVDQNKKKVDVLLP